MAPPSPPAKHCRSRLSRLPEKHSEYMAPCPSMNSGGESRSSPVPLFAHFHVLTALGGTHLLQDSYLFKKPKAQETWSWKAAAAWDLGRRTEMLKAFTGTAAGPQDTEGHRWAALRQVFLQNIPFQRRKDWGACDSTEFSQKDVATSSVPSTDTTAACRVLEGTRVTSVPAANLFRP